MDPNSSGYVDAVFDELQDEEGKDYGNNMWWFLESLEPTVHKIFVNPAVDGWTLTRGVHRILGEAPEIVGCKCFVGRDDNLLVFYLQEGYETFDDAMDLLSAYLDFRAFTPFEHEEEASNHIFWLGDSSIENSLCTVLGD